MALVADAARLAPYWRRLGVSHLYLSPITEARQGSTHGYDVVDHNTVRAAFGGREGLDRLLAAAAEHGLKLILDWVPNHAGVGPRNAAWQDVLAYGPHSPHARAFDMDRVLRLIAEEEEDLGLIRDLLETMAASKADFTLTFRRLCEAAIGPDGEEPTTTAMLTSTSAPRNAPTNTIM